MSKGHLQQQHHSSEIHEEVEEAEPWLVSYADMMTLLFGFFVLMYSFAASQLDDSSGNWIKVKKELAAFFGGGELESEKKSSSGESSELFSPNVGIEISGKSGSRRESQGIFEDSKSNSEKQGKSDSEGSDTFVGGTFVSPGSGLNNSEIKNILDIKKVMDSDKALEIILRGSSLFLARSAKLTANGSQTIGTLCSKIATIRYPFFLSITAFSQAEKKIATKTLGAESMEFGTPDTQTIERARVVMQEIAKCPGTLKKAFNLSAVGVGYIPGAKTLEGVMEDGVIIRINVALDF